MVCIHKHVPKISVLLPVHINYQFPVKEWGAITSIIGKFSKWSVIGIPDSLPKLVCNMTLQCFQLQLFYPYILNLPQITPGS